MLTLVLAVCCSVAVAQQAGAPGLPTGTVFGVVVDTEDAAIPRAAITIEGPTPGDRQSIVSDGDGSFVMSNLRPAIPYRITISASGFTTWNSTVTVPGPGQTVNLNEITLKVTAEVTVSAVMPEQIAVQEVQAEVNQRVLGFIPNFYVVYDSEPVPLSAKLKFRLSLRASTDVVSFAAAAFLAGIDQAADRPGYVQGAKGFGQRFGASYANGVSDILIGGAVLPSLLHQDPRYYYQGSGTNSSRAIHAISAPFVCKGDNGREQFNYSSIGGDLISGALANLYYPKSDRGASIFFESALITTGGRIANAIAQEFVLSRFTTRAKKHH